MHCIASRRLLPLALVLIASSSALPTLPAAERDGAVRVREDSFDWRITRAQITWQLDQKMVEQLHLSSEEVNQRERALRESIVQNISAEAAVRSSFEASAHVQSTLSLNPLRMLTGNAAEMRVDSELQLWGKLGASVAKSVVRDNTECTSERTASSVDISFVRAISQPRIQFTVILRNRLPNDLLCKNLVIPIWGPESVLAQAVPVDEKGDRLSQFTVPARRPDGIDQLFVAKVADTVLWDFVRDGGLSKALDLRLERGEGKIVSSATGEELISQRTDAQRNCMRMKVQLPGGAEITWWVERPASGRAAVAEILAGVNDLLKQRLATDMPAFSLEDGALVSAFGCDQYLSGWVWDVRSDGEAAVIGEDLHKLKVRDSVSLGRRWSNQPERIAAPRGPSAWWRLAVARQRMIVCQPPENADELMAIAQGASPWAPHATYRLGAMYEKGRGLSRDYSRAAKCYRKAAEQGNLNAMCALGSAYANGRGVAKDEADAVKWYRMSSEEGCPDGTCSLAWCYADGQGIAKDEGEAVRLFHKATDAGDAWGIVCLGNMYSDGRGVKKDDAEALRLFRKAAQAGERSGICNVGWAYAKGRGVPQDQAEAVKWYRKAADAGYPEAMINLGLSYANGEGVPKDPAEA